MAEPITDREGLRQRNVPLQTASSNEARQTVLDLNSQEEKRDVKDEIDKKTYGRTPTGTVFTVPFTKDMVSMLLWPTEPKNWLDLFVVMVLALHILLILKLPADLRVPVFGTIFLFWRLAYNAGIGCILHRQSHDQWLVRWVQKRKIFNNPAEGDNPHPGLYYFLKRDFEKKIVKDYDFTQAPIEYNTWLLFRRLVDLILMCDFVTYMLFAMACGHQPSNESLVVFIGRWSLGIILFAFNLWVKLDAHRVVKDFAWYWGDFFFLVDQELTFDGVFEMAPHPMYTIGYLGYYGIALMAASYEVLFISVLAHAAQVTFLVWVENPHIERTYTSPPPKIQVSEVPRMANGTRPSPTRNDTGNTWADAVSNQPPATHNLLGISNLDLYRTTDSSVILLQVLIFCLTVLTPDTPVVQSLFILGAALCRMWYSIGIGYLLNRQSSKKKWTRHFLKYGESTWEAWRQWKGHYHLSMVLCYSSFVAASWKMYRWPTAWNQDLTLLKHIMGAGLIALQIWVAASIYESLGEFGWFFGDFFFNQSPKLTYDGIYRFLNNPERFLGLAGVWGAALITGSPAIFGLALLSQALSLAFIHYVERPHMLKIYGRKLRQDAGLVRSIRRSLPPPLRNLQQDLDKMIGGGLDKLEEFLEHVAKDKLVSGVTNVFHDTRELFNRYPARISITRVDSEIIGINPRDYMIEFEPMSDKSSQVDNISEANNVSHTPETSQCRRLIDYGAPIKVRWTAPTNHSKLDWIGLYQVSDNSSRELTRSSSAGRWTATNKGEYETLGSERKILTFDEPITKYNYDTALDQQYLTGEVLFEGDKLFWTQGVFEFRYHHNGKHNVMALSETFEIRIPRFSEDELMIPPGPNTAAAEEVIRHSIEQALLPVVRNCFDRDPTIAPSTSQEVFGGLVERDGKFAKRVVYAVKEMFGIEFTPEVVKADGKVENLAWRVWEAKKVLAPYSLSRSCGVGTPVEVEVEKDE